MSEINHDVVLFAFNFKKKNPFINYYYRNAFQYTIPNSYNATYYRREK